MGEVSSIVHPKMFDSQKMYNRFNNERRDNMIEI